MCNTEECFPKAGKCSMNVSPPLSLIQSTFIAAFLCKGILRETKMNKTGFTVNSFLRCFLSLTFYDLMKMEVRTKKVLVTSVPLLFHIFQFIFLSCVFESIWFHLFSPYFLFYFLLFLFLGHQPFNLTFHPFLLPKPWKMQIYHQ